MDIDYVTPIGELPERLAALRAQQRRAPRCLDERLSDLYDLRAALRLNLPELVRAMDADFGTRSRHESMLSDGMTVLRDIDHLLAHLKSWMRPKRRLLHPLFWPARGELRYQPLGVVGVISPWNYPINLALVPLATALAAGNAVYLKPSEHTPRTSAALCDLLRTIYPRNRVDVALGGAELAATFAALPFDHLFFTGSTAVGRRVMAAAAPHLPPLTLELGGKSPVLIAPDYPLARAASRIAAGKFINAGQTCIAPDYALVPHEMIDAFVAALRAEAQSRYPDIALSGDFTRIINAAQYQRLRSAGRSGGGGRTRHSADRCRCRTGRRYSPAATDSRARCPGRLPFDARGNLRPHSCRCAATRSSMQHWITSNHTTGPWRFMSSIMIDGAWTPH